jgi:hypothetical protein
VLKLRKSNEKVKQKIERKLDEGSLSKKGKVLLFYTREGKLNCEGVQINNLYENFVNPYTNEIYSLKDIAFYDEQGYSIFCTYRGFNFSTSFKFDSEKQVFYEKEYDKKYMKMCRQSQAFERAFGNRKRFTFTHLLYYIVGLSIVGIIALLTFISLIYIGVK